MICKLISTFDEQINFTQRLGYTIVFKQIALPIGKAIKELTPTIRAAQTDGYDRFSGLDSGRFSVRRTILRGGQFLF